jgi:hypothetical protein
VSSDAFFFSFPVIFGEGYGWNDGFVGLTFIPVLFGVAIALFVTPQLEKLYHKASKEKGGKADPEDRLPGMMWGAPLVPIGERFMGCVPWWMKLKKDKNRIALFIVGWTSPNAVMPGGGNWVGPVSGGTVDLLFSFVIVANFYLWIHYRHSFWIGNGRRHPLQHSRLYARSLQFCDV